MMMGEMMEGERGLISALATAVGGLGLPGCDNCLYSKSVVLNTSARECHSACT